MQLVAYFYGITKDRRLCEEVRYNLACSWFCRLSLGEDAPDHSSLTRIRDRLGEKVFEAVFRRIVVQCREKGLVSSAIVHTPGRERSRRRSTQRHNRKARPIALMVANKLRNPAACAILKGGVDFLS
jgi:transposase